MIYHCIFPTDVIVTVLGDMEGDAGYDKTTFPGVVTPLVKTEKNMSVVVVGGVSVALLNSTPEGKVFDKTWKFNEEQTTLILYVLEEILTVTLYPFKIEELIHELGFTWDAAFARAKLTVFKKSKYD